MNKQVIKNYSLKNAEEMMKAIRAGKETPDQGLLEQWLREGKMTEAEAIMASGDMFAAGVDSVSCIYIAVTATSI